MLFLSMEGNIMIQIACNGIKKYYGAQLVLSNITLEAQEQECYAIVGKNGCGKTTLLKLLMGKEQPDEGTIAIRKGATIGYLEQIPIYDDKLTVKEIIQQAFSQIIEIKAVMTEMEQKMACCDENELEKVMDRYSNLTQSYESLGGYEMEERFAKICSGLRLSDYFLSQTFKELSGGEKTLAGLAKVLLQNPDILLLDEPTNHLDLSMLQWLEEYITSYKGTVLIVSHDRYFLNRTVNKVIEMTEGCSKTYVGNYDDYVTARDRERDDQLHAYKEQQKQIKSMEHAMNEMRRWAKQADSEAMFKRAENMRKRIERIERLEKPKEQNEGILVTFDEADRSGKDVVRINNVSKSFGERMLFEQANLEVFYKEHVAILGRNGCGKTTLIRMLLQEEVPDEGSLSLGSSIHLGYIPQQIVFTDEEKTVLETFREDLMVTEGKARELLARKQFYGESVFSKVKNLSGGEKMRLKLAIIMQGQINFLILDEPTNHLDIESREKLEEALLSFEGSILFVSHDRYFIDRISTKIVEIEDKSIKSYQGNFQYYQEEKAKEIKVKEENAKEEKSKDERSRNAGKELINRKESQKINMSKKENEILKQEIVKKKQNTFRVNQLETTIKELDITLKNIETKMKDCSEDYQELVELMDEKSKIEKKQELYMEEWLELTME